MVRRAVAQALVLMCLAGGCSLGRPLAEPPAISDSAITAAVKRALAADSGSNFQRVNVETRNAIVTLTGMVELWAERARAEQLAYKANGVTLVVNDLRVDPLPAPR
jgi:osmotically-inducible protein OsmY